MSEKSSVFRSRGSTRGRPTWSVRSRKELEANKLRWSQGRGRYQGIFPVHAMRDQTARATNGRFK